MDFSTSTGVIPNGLLTGMIFLIEVIPECGPIKIDGRNPGINLGLSPHNLSIWMRLPMQPRASLKVKVS